MKKICAMAVLTTIITVLFTEARLQTKSNTEDIIILKVKEKIHYELLKEVRNDVKTLLKMGF